MKFDADNFYVEGAVEDHGPFDYVMDDGSLAISMRGHYTMGEMAWAMNALEEANRRYKRKVYVEVVEDSFAGGWRTVIWRDGVAGVYSDWPDRKQAYAEVERLTGRYGDHGFLKEQA